MNRRKFLTLQKPLFSAIKPIVVATWDSGMPVNAAAWEILAKNGKSLDAVEAGAIFIENQINCCVGLGGYPDRDGIVTLDSCIMDEKANCGAVAGLERIKHPVSVARKVMENTPHVLLVGAGAQQFALENGFTLEPKQLSEDAQKAYTEWLKKSEYKPVINIENSKPGNNHGPFAPAFFEDGSPNHDTMGLIALDNSSNLSGAVTTSGMAYKIHGRVGEHTVVEYMRRGYSPAAACKKAVERIVKRDPQKAKEIQVGFLALNKKGQYGAYAIQKGFVFSVKSVTENRIVPARHLI